MQKAAGGDCHRQSFQKPKWSSIPRQCAHWHGICWMRGCFRRKRRNPAFLNEMRAGRILKEDGLVCGSKPFSASLSRILSPFLGGTRKGPPEGHPAQIFDRAFDKRRPAGVWRQSTGLPGLYRRGASITCKSPRRRSLKNSLGGDLLCLKSPAAAIGLAARSVSGHRRCLSGFPADALPFCAAVPGAPAVGDPVPAEGH